MEKLLKTLSVEEKIRLCAGKNNWQTDDLGGKLYSVMVADGPLGLRVPTDLTVWSSGDTPAVAYPSSQVLAQTWDPSLAYKTGECLADDCIERGVDVLLAPGVNIKRSPYCGRNFEYFSEDPYASGVFGREYIRGVQAHNVGTSLKHFCANNIEFGRYWVSSEVDERTLREIYLRPFEIACKADPTTVMSSYNRVNGRFMSEHGKLYSVLRSEFWREDGLIMSDWKAVRDHVESVKNGCDLEMPYSEKNHKALLEAYNKGEITEEEIDKCVMRVLKLIKLCEANKELRRVETTVEERMDAAQRVATEGAVLLKNDGVLPLKSNAKVNIVGRRGADEYFSGSGSSKVVNYEKPMGLDAAFEALMPDAEISTGAILTGLRFENSFKGSIGKDAVFYICGDAEKEALDRYSMKLADDDVFYIKELAKVTDKLVVIIHYGAAVDVSEWEDKVAGIIYAGYGGCRGNEALAALLCGRANFSGRLSETFANTYEDYPCASLQHDYAVNRYSEGLDVGYRYFDTHEEKVRYPFGFGLSYSSFKYSDLKVTRDGEQVKVSFSVENTSKIDGAEVPQVYVHEVYPVVYRPYKELKAFEKVWLKAGESKELSFTLCRRDFSYYSVAYDRWTVNAGEFEILVGKDAHQICLKQCISYN